MSSPMQHGAFSWLELMTSDLKGAEAFYGQLFGWAFKDGPVDGMEYRMAAAGGQDVGGLMALPENLKQAPPSWGAYVTVDDVDETAKQAETLGGKVLMQPYDIPTVGRMTVIQDPQGAVISAITYTKCE
jgi:uncharacterized protein